MGIAAKYQTTAQFVKEITVDDPITKGQVILEVYRHENGGMFAIDSSFLEHVDDTSCDNQTIIADPFSIELRRDILLKD